MALVAAELIGASDGLGFLINDARFLLRTDIIVVGIRHLAARLLPWSTALAR